MVALSEQDVSLFIPHRATMQMLSRVVRGEADVTEGELDILPDNPFCFNGRIAAVTGIEWMAQVVAAHGGLEAWREGRDADVGFLLGTPKCTVAVAYFEPGQRLRIRAEKIWGDEEMLQFHCTIHDRADDREVMSGNLNVFRPRDLQGYVSAGEGSGA
ncbi:ApeP family dehydratase [Acanthopleuribacter pedis]|uniref:3-hydroxylacyl-ACP dehydratase n=1 Tax=Acanthopleuribacter pedis TaxID=442870 RepID=A0A8J7U5A7_9BACT|nr:hypothetical protein [Acanthopleuribacter pedis]MBO1320654.1 hypothetical protein [Acanthopleuribacter pedis]